MLITNKTTQSVITEAEYWETYRQKRKQEIEEIETTITESLTYMG
jgi:hypothetical protein